MTQFTTPGARITDILSDLCSELYKRTGYAPTEITLQPPLFRMLISEIPKGLPNYRQSAKPIRDQITLATQSGKLLIHKAFEPCNLLVVTEHGEEGRCRLKVGHQSACGIFVQVKRVPRHCAGVDCHVRSSKPSCTCPCVECLEATMLPLGVKP